jgi:hypothetical protein
VLSLLAGGVILESPYFVHPCRYHNHTCSGFRRHWQHSKRPTCKDSAQDFHATSDPSRAPCRRGPPQPQYQPQDHFQYQPRQWGEGYDYRRYYNHQPNTGEKQEVVLPRLMRTMGNTGVCILFMILTARCTQTYELADQIRSPVVRYAVIAPVLVLLIGDLLGVLFSIVQHFSRNSRLKTRLKLLLNLNGLMEMVLLLHNVVQLLGPSSQWVPREAYLGRIFTSVWILTLVYAFTTARWDTDPVLS